MTRRIFHLKWPHWKHEENSIRGAIYAAEHGYDAIDLDLQLTADQVIVVTHWSRPMRRDRFYDLWLWKRGNPRRHRIDPDTPISRLTWSQVKRLRTPDGYRIRRVGRMLKVCARLGITAVLEPKTPAFAADWIWQHIARLADADGTDVEAYALRSHGGEATMRAARRNGVRPARVIDR